MVRVVCPNFQPPRSRHNSGDPDSVDRDLAKRTAAALTTRLEARRDELMDLEDVSNDSFCESDGDHTPHSETVHSDETADEPSNGEEIQKKRKQRRRERNKLSAQAYRQRRKEQAMAQQKILYTLEEEHKRLMEKVQNLEKEKQQVETFLRSCVQNPAAHDSATLQQNTESGTDNSQPLCNNINNNKMDFDNMNSNMNNANLNTLCVVAANSRAISCSDASQQLGKMVPVAMPMSIP